MKSKLRLNRIEYVVYAILLLIIVLGPTLSTLFHGHELDDIDFLVSDVLHTLKLVTVYIIAFAIHDLIIAPLLVYKHKTWLYFLGVIALCGVFMLYQCNFHPNEPELPSFKIENTMPTKPSPQQSQEPSTGQVRYAQPPPISNNQDPLTPPPFRRHDILALIMFLLCIGTNIGIKFYFRSIDARKEMEELEKANLSQNLVQLRYQLHPHFFMNTLNNIHALVDINPEKAQECIINLSKLMRYVLYESNHDYVQAAREIEFMENYVSLSRIRYSDKLKFTVTNLDDGTSVWIPPLIFISFVENAFKHGVSNRNESFIDINSKIYEGDNATRRLLWTCRNSKRKEKGDNGSKKVSEASGIGLSNVRQRLDLIFGSNYSLDIEDGSDEYSVKLDIPVYDNNPNLSTESKKN